MKKYIIIITALTFMASCSQKKTADTEQPAEEKQKGFDIADIDSSADICNDFYSWAVGDWIKNNPVPSTESRWMSFNILNKQNEEKLQAILDDLCGRHIGPFSGSISR